MKRSERLPWSSRYADARGDRYPADLPTPPRALVDHRRFGDGTLWSFDGVAVAELNQEPTPDLPIFRFDVSDDDTVSVIFLREGEVTVSHDGGQFRFSAGSAAFFSASETTSVEVRTFSRVTLVSVPRRNLRAAGVEVAHPFGPFAYATAGSSPLLSFVTALIEVVERRTIPVEPTATVLRRLVADLFLLDESYGPGPHGSALDVRAFAESLATLRGAHSIEPGILSPRELARRAGFATERELNRAFTTAYSTTVKEVLLQQAFARGEPLAPVPSAIGAESAALLAPTQVRSARVPAADSPARASVPPGDRTG